MKCNGVSFTSKINFISAPDFEKVAKGAFVSFSDNPNDERAVRKADDFYTCSVRTCTAGGLIDSKNKEAVGFHYYDGPKNNQAIVDYVDKLFRNVKNPDKALILGGKKLIGSPYSMEQFLKIKELLSQRVDNLTVFEKHNFPWSESDMYYSLDDDTWRIHTMYRPLTEFREHSVLSPEDLKKAFEKVNLAKDDTLQIKGLDITI